MNAGCLTSIHCLFFPQIHCFAKAKVSFSIEPLTNVAGPADAPMHNRGKRKGCLADGLMEFVFGEVRKVFSLIVGFGFLKGQLNRSGSLGGILCN